MIGVGAAAVLVAALGPRPSVQERWTEPAMGEDVTAYLETSESDVPRLRVEAAKEIVWADPAERAHTPVSIVYVHGFSADRHELEPLGARVAGALGANLFFTRLTGHGRDGEAMAEATEEDWLDDVVEAIAVGEAIGDRVVLLGTSTGGTLAMWAAARPEAEGRIAALVLLSPNFRPAAKGSRLLLYPWGGVLARLVVGKERCFTPENERQEQHWTTCYPTSALLPMMGLVEHVRTMDLSRIAIPTLVVYDPEDSVVDATETERLLERMRGITTPVAVRYRDTEDPSHHVLAGDVLSPGSTEPVAQILVDFLSSVVQGPESTGGES